MAVSLNTTAVIDGVGHRVTTKRIVFTGAAGAGAIGTVAVATVTGAVLIENIIPYCKTDVGVDGGTGAASMSLGVTGAVAQFVASTTATAIDAGELWTTNTPTLYATTLPAAMKEIAVASNIIIDVTSTGTQKVTSGEIHVNIVWAPASVDGALV